MADKPQKYASDSLDATGEFFSVSAPLHPVRPGYIRRDADELLFQTLITGHNAHVIAPDRTGKSSLISATSARLQNNGVKVAVLDLRQIAERDGGADAARWYYSIAYRLLRQLRLKIDLQDWWQDKSILSNRQRLVEFYIEVLLHNIKEPIVVFVDEVHSIANKRFGRHLLASIRAAHNSRTTEPEFARLSFALLGECDPFELIDEPAESPFLVSKQITLGDFSREDLDIFATELNLAPSDAGVALDQIYYWTNGHPYLSQKLARSVARDQISGDIVGHVDRIAMQQLAGRAALHSEPHMSHIHRRVVNDRKNYEGLLNLYGKLRKGIQVPDDQDSRSQRQLAAIGLVVRKRGYLSVRNKIYETVFTARWANNNLPLHWRGPAIALAVIVAITALPFWYTQMLPRPYMQIMFSQTLDAETVADAYRNLRSFPGHADTADRLFESFLVTRAGQASEVADITEIERFARQLTAMPDLADRLVSEYWDRQFSKFVRAERRDEALMAALESLLVSTSKRRRRAAQLIGNDYPQLIGTVRTPPTSRAVLNADEMLISYVDGGEISQSSLINRTLQTRAPWSISALEVTPLLRRVFVDREGTVERIGLTINVSHARLGDLWLRLIAPSGRTADLSFNQASSTANEQIRISREQLSPMQGEPLNGTWSLSIRDEAGGVSGHLVAWDLSLNSQVLVENFERGLDIPDPVARVSDNLWLSPDGRYAIARAMQSDSARLWDLTYAQAARTIAVPASERVLGLSANAEFLVTVGVDTINLWRTVNGRKHAVLPTGIGSGSALLTRSGHHLLVQRQGEADTVFELWSLGDAQKAYELSVAGVPALVAMDDAGDYIALGDYDRSVRVWNLRTGELRMQFDMAVQPSAIQLSPNADALGVVHGDQGVSLWRTDRADDPLMQLRGPGLWQLKFSRSGLRLLAGNSGDGYQVFSTLDGSASGPPLGSGIEVGQTGLIDFSADERVVVTASSDGLSRFWNAPLAATNVSSAAGAAATGQATTEWRDSGHSIAAISPGGERLAIGDARGHVHILPADAAAESIGGADDEISFLGHQAAVSHIAFSEDGSLVASVGVDGSIRVWDAHSGLPRPYYANWSATAVQDIVFSASGRRLALLSGQRLWIMEVENGNVLTDLDLGEWHSGVVFAADDLLYVAGESGVLRSLNADRGGSFNLRNVWQGPTALRNLQISRDKQQLVIVDSLHRAQVLHLKSGRVGQIVLTLPSAVSDIVFSPSNSRVLFKTSGWIHRTGISNRGLTWLEAIRAPKFAPGSRMAFDRPMLTEDAAVDAGVVNDPTGDRLLVLTRDTGFAEIADLRFSHSAGPSLLGNRESLIDEWQSKLDAALTPPAPTLFDANLASDPN